MNEQALDLAEAAVLAVLAKLTQEEREELMFRIHRAYCRECGSDAGNSCVCRRDD